MTPSVQIIYALLGLALLGFFSSLREDLAGAWALIACGTLLVLIADSVLVFLLKRPGISRRHPGRFALGVEAEVELLLTNPNSLPVRIAVFDGIPGSSRSSELPWRGRVPGKRELFVRYNLRMLKRGTVHFEPAHLRILSPLGFWERRLKMGTPDKARVYPNFEPVLRLMLLALQNRENQMGIIKKNLAGVSRDFHQLRDYKEGDNLSQIDWKATSKRLSLVSRDYQEQRDQTIILMLDRGRRMRSMDGELPQFDHCLNSMLLLSYVALRQGDQIGVLGFGAATSWFPPVRGPHSMNPILNHLYDYETQSVPSDYSEAVNVCLRRQKRRALVVVLTNLRSEDSRELEPALRSLRSRHLVMLASLREQEVDQRREGKIHTLTRALSCASAHMYMEEREKILGQLRSLGILTLDETAQNLPVALANSYFDIKQKGMI